MEDNDIRELFKELHKIDTNFSLENGIINGSGLGLTKVPDVLKNTPFHLNLADNDISFLDGCVQNGIWRMSNNRIESLENIIQTETIYLNNNRINNLNGFVQNTLLCLNNNKITSLENFVQQGYLSLYQNEIHNIKNFKIDNNSFLYFNDLILNHHPSQEHKDFFLENMIRWSFYEENILSKNI